jgi:hypothetical protein
VASSRRCASSTRVPSTREGSRRLQPTRDAGRGRRRAADVRRQRTAGRGGRLRDARQGEQQSRTRAGREPGTRTSARCSSRTRSARRPARSTVHTRC